MSPKDTPRHPVAWRHGQPRATGFEPTTFTIGKGAEVYVNSHESKGLPRSTIRRAANKNRPDHADQHLLGGRVGEARRRRRSRRRSRCPSRRAGRGNRRCRRCRHRRRSPRGTTARRPGSFHRPGCCRRVWAFLAACRITMSMRPGNIVMAAARARTVWLVHTSGRGRRRHLTIARATRCGD